MIAGSCAPARIPFPKDPRNQIIGFKNPNTIHMMVLRPKNLIIWVLGLLGFTSQEKHVLVLPVFGMSRQAQVSCIWQGLRRPMLFLTQA